MALLDPFYGIFGFGRFVSRWLNRILVVAEVALIIWGFKYHCEYVWLPFEKAYRYIYFPACLIALGIINNFIRLAWSLVVVLVHGTANTDEIIAHHEEKIENRRQLANYIAWKRGLRDERAKLRVEEKRRKRIAANKKEIDDFLKASPEELIRKNSKRRFIPLLPLRRL